MFNVPPLSTVSATAKLVAALALVIGLLATHGCVAWLAWTAKANQVDAQKLDEVVEQVEADRKEQRRRDDVNAEVVGEKAHQDAAADAEFRDIRKEVPDAARPAARPQPAVPADCPRCNCEFDARFIGLWNRALEATVPDPAARADVAAAGSGSPGGGSVDAEEILGNHVDNAEIHADNRRQCESLMTWADRELVREH